MKKILLITILALSLQANQCWNLETQNWINFNWVKNAKDLINAIDENHRQLHAYHLHDEIVSCFYTDSEYK
tara:strand:+ start:778 stop:990 length:213 start_codon:yes stop_codon:yes gene_type:complete